MLTGDAKRAVALGSDRVDHRMVVAEQFLPIKVTADEDVAKESYARLRGDLLVDPGNRLDFLMIRRDAAAYQSKGSGEPIDEVDFDSGVLLQQMFRGIEPRRPGADDRHPQWIGGIHAGGK